MNESKVDTAVLRNTNICMFSADGTAAVSIGDSIEGQIINRLTISRIQIKDYRPACHHRAIPVVFTAARSLWDTSAS
jgi:hypothetical protein